MMRGSPLIRNTAWRGINLGGSKALMFVFFVAAGRLAGVDDFGYLVFALAVMQIAMTLMDFGLSVALARFAGEKPASAADGFGAAFEIRGFTFIAGGFALLGFLCFHPLPAAAQYLVLILGFSAGADSVAGLYRALYTAGRNLRTDAWATLSGRAVFVLFGALALWEGLALVWVGAAHLCGNLVTVWFLARRPPILSTPTFSDKSHQREIRNVLWETAWPLALAEAFTVVYFRIDQVLIEAFRGAGEVALYGAAYKLVEGAMVLPAALLIASFAGLVQRAKQPALLAKSVSTLEAFLLITAFCGAGFGFVWAPGILTTVFGPPYGEAAPVLRILMPALVLIYANYLLTQLMVAAKLQRPYLILAAGCAIFNIIANLWAIPKYGISGAAWTSVGAEMLLLIGAKRVLRPVVSVLALKNTGVGILLGACCTGVGYGLYFFVGFPWGMIAHFAVCAGCSACAGAILHKRYGPSR